MVLTVVNNHVPHWRNQRVEIHLDQERGTVIGGGGKRDRNVCFGSFFVSYSSIIRIGVDLNMQLLYLVYLLHRLLLDLQWHLLPNLYLQFLMLLCLLFHVNLGLMFPLILFHLFLLIPLHLFLFYHHPPRISSPPLFAPRLGRSQSELPRRRKKHR